MALHKVYLWDALTEAMVAGTLPDIKYIGSPPGLPITVTPGTEEAEMSDKSRRVAFFSGPSNGAWREFTLAWGYLIKAELNVLLGRVALKVILTYRNEFEETTPGVGPAETYSVYITSFGYEFVRTGIRDLQRFKADMSLREV